MNTVEPVLPSLFDLELFEQLPDTDQTHPLQRAGIDERTELDIIFNAQGRNIFVTEV